MSKSAVTSLPWAIFPPINYNHNLISTHQNSIQADTKGSKNHSLSLIWTLSTFLQWPVGTPVWISHLLTVFQWEFVARPRQCLTLSNFVPWQNWMAAYLGCTLRMKTLFCGWPVMVHDTHTRRRRSGSCSVNMYICDTFATFSFPALSCPVLPFQLMVISGVRFKKC